MVCHMKRGKGVVVQGTHYPFFVQDEAECLDN